MKQCWNQGNEIIFISWKNIFDRKIQRDRKAFMAFSILDVHTYELASVCDRISNWTRDLNHFFQSLRWGSISKWHLINFPEKLFYNFLCFKVWMLQWSSCNWLPIHISFLNFFDKLPNSYLVLITSVSLVHKQKFYMLK